MLFFLQGSQNVLQQATGRYSHSKFMWIHYKANLFPSIISKVYIYRIFTKHPWSQQAVEENALKCILYDFWTSPNSAGKAASKDA